MRCIAVIEDNRDNRMLLEALLEDRYRIVEFDSGPAALAGLAEASPDVVLLDISMPGMDGPEVLKRMREDEALKDLPVIALTAHAMTGDREQFLAAGFDDYVAKPILDEATLLDAISRTLAPE